MRARHAVLACLAAFVVACLAGHAAEEQQKVRLPEGWTSQARKVKAAAPAKDVELQIDFYSKPAGAAAEQAKLRPFEFVLIKPGEFLMSSPANEKGRYEDEPAQHPASIVRPFLLATCEVTEQQYYAVMSPEVVPPEPDRAKEGVNRANADEFCKRMSQRDGVTYRLPTETEWEYACRAGSTTPYYWGRTLRDDCAWGKDNSGEQTHVVGAKLPNAWGIYDMSGNVWEWCAGPEGTVLRGGSYGGAAAGLRTARRFSRLKGHNDYSGCGIRLVVELPAPPAP